MYRVIDLEGRYMTMDITGEFKYTKHEAKAYEFNNLEKTEDLIYNIDEDVKIIDEDENIIVTNIL